MGTKINLKEVIADNNLTVLAGENYIDRDVTVDMLTRPGVELAGFFDFYEPQRLVLMGSKETTFFNQLPYDDQVARMDKFLSFNPPAFVFSHRVNIPKLILDKGNEYNVPILKGDLRTTPLSSKLYGYLQEHLALRLSVHGVLLDINGMGTLITGKSGIGKSEIALELVKRGHQLISDDRVEIFQKNVGVLIGAAPEILERYMEIRGIGIVDVVQMFGAGAYRDNKKIRLVVELEQWEEGKFYDRIGLENLKVKYFDTEVDKIVLPVSPGRNVATLVEAAATNQKLKYMGVNSAEQFADEVQKLINKGGKSK